MNNAYEKLPFEDLDPVDAELMDAATSDRVLRKWMRPIETHVALTEEFVRAAVCGPKESWVNDTVCRGLTLRLRPTGGKSYYWVKSTVEDAGAGKQFIGDSADFTISQARTKIRWLTAGIRIDTAPRKYRRDLRIVQVIEKYFQENPPESSAWFKTAKKLFEAYVVQRYGESWLSGIGKDRWLTLIEAACLDNPSRGENLHKALRSFLNWAVKRGLLQANPLARTKVGIPIFPDPPKQLVLDMGNLVSIHRAAQKLGPPWSSMIGLAIFSGEAMEHVRRIHSSDLDWDQRIWAIDRRVAPRWTVRLSSEMVDLLAIYRGSHGYLFKSPRRDWPINFYTEVLDQLRGTAYVGWKWSLRDIRIAVRSQIDKFGNDPDASLLWSQKMAKAFSGKDDEEVVL